MLSLLTGLQINHSSCQTCSSLGDGRLSCIGTAASGTHETLAFGPGVASITVSQTHSVMHINIADSLWDTRSAQRAFPRAKVGIPWDQVSDSVSVVEILLLSMPSHHMVPTDFAPILMETSSESTFRANPILRLILVPGGRNWWRIRHVITISKINLIKTTAAAHRLC